MILLHSIHSLIVGIPLQGNIKHLKRKKDNKLIRICETIRKKRTPLQVSVICPFAYHFSLLWKRFPNTPQFIAGFFCQTQTRRILCIALLKQRKVKKKKFFFLSFLETQNGKHNSFLLNEFSHELKLGAVPRGFKLIATLMFTLSEKYFDFLAFLIYQSGTSLIAHVELIKGGM